MKEQTNRTVVILAQHAEPDLLNGQALPSLSCQVSSGETVFIMGLNSSILLPYINMLAGIELPVKGKVLILGKDASQFSELDSQLFRQQVGFVQQGGALLSVLNGFENLMLPARYHQIADEKSLQKKAALLISEMPCKLNNDILPAFMTPLQHRLLAIARPLMLDPQLLFIDRPFVGLGHHDRAILGRYISNIAKSRPITVVICSDDLHFVHSLADQIIFCDNNEVLVFENWASFYQCKQQAIELLFKHEHINKNA